MSAHEPDGIVTVTVPQMADRRDIRAVTAPVRDLPGVVAVQVDLATRQVHVHGAVSVADVRAAVVGAGYGVVDGA